MELLCPFANKEDRYTALQNLRRGEIDLSLKVVFACCFKIDLFLKVKFRRQ